MGMTMRYGRFGYCLCDTARYGRFGYRWVPKQPTPRHGRIPKQQVWRSAVFSGTQTDRLTYPRYPNRQSHAAAGASVLAGSISEARRDRLTDDNMARERHFGLLGEKPRTHEPNFSATAPEKFGSCARVSYTNQRNMQESHTDLTFSRKSCRKVWYVCDRTASRTHEPNFSATAPEKFGSCATVTHTNQRNVQVAAHGPNFHGTPTEK